MDPLNPAAGQTVESLALDKLIAGDADGIITDKVIILAGQNIVRGAVLGKITATGKYILSLSAAADGSQVPDRIAAQDINAVADTEAEVYRTGRFNDNALTLGAAHTVASISEGLRGKGIHLVHGQPA
jgi:hypothetical protein